MDYQNIINLLDNTPNQPTRFRTTNLVEVNNGSRETCKTNSHIRFKT